MTWHMNIRTFHQCAVESKLREEVFYIGSNVNELDNLYCYLVCLKSLQVDNSDFMVYLKSLQVNNSDFKCWNINNAHMV